MSHTFYTGDALDPQAYGGMTTVNAVVTSPPFWGLREYGSEEEIGSEESIEGWIENITYVVRNCMDVLADDGLLFIEVGDAYDKKGSLLRMPWRLVEALCVDLGLLYRDEIIWRRPNPMPTPTKTRTTRAHTVVLMLAMQRKHYYDRYAITTEPVRQRSGNKRKVRGDEVGVAGQRGQFGRSVPWEADDRGVPLRSVWDIAPDRSTLKGHSATMPLELARRCILLGSRPGGTILDPFCGTGTTAMAAAGEGRHSISFDLNPFFVAHARARLADAA